MPETQSKEKIDFLRMIGADLRLVRPKPLSRSRQLRALSRALPRSWREETSGAIWANQFDNLANRDGASRRRPARRSGSRPTAASMRSPAPAAPAARWPASRAR